MSDTKGWPDNNQVPTGVFKTNENEFAFDSQAARDLIYKQAYFELCFPITGKMPSEEPPDEEAFRVQVLKYLEKHRERVHNVVCVNMKWCEIRKKHDLLFLPMPLLIALALFLADLSVGGIPSATWMASTGLLDRFCECAKRQ